MLKQIRSDRKALARWLAACLAVGMLVISATSAADFTPDQIGRVERLPAKPEPRWLWVYDMVYDYMANGRATLIDGDNGRFLGMLNTGYSFNQLTLPRDHSAIYAAETHYSRTTRGERTDIVAIYDPATLNLVDEILIPPKRGSTIPTLNNVVLTDNDRFLLVFNFTPAASVSVVDVKARKFLTEIPTPGCALIYPSGTHRFFMLSADGTACEVTLAEDGRLAELVRSEPFFDAERDPITEKGVRWGDRWFFVSFAGMVHEIDGAGDRLQFVAPWSLLSEADRKDHWKIGGTQHLAVHQPSGRFYSIMHQFDPAKNSRKTSGVDIWVYDLGARERVQTLKLREHAGLIQVSQDAKPLLFTADVPVNTIHVYDGSTGAYLRSVERIGYTPTGLVTPWRPSTP
jgi:methylamine dehydrogenase heavy chain